MDNLSWEQIEELCAGLKGHCTIHPPSTMVDSQIALSSYPGFLACFIEKTAGIQIRNLIRLLGSGNTEIKRSVDYVTASLQNAFEELPPLVVFADDVFGGHFLLFENEDEVVYFAPDALNLENLDTSYEDFIRWCFTTSILEFYQTFLWEDYETFLTDIPFDKAVSIYPPLWANECEIQTASKRIVPADEVFGVTVEILRQLPEE